MSDVNASADDHSADDSIDQSSKDQPSKDQLSKDRSHRDHSHRDHSHREDNGKDVEPPASSAATSCATQERPSASDTTGDTDIFADYYSQPSKSSPSSERAFGNLLRAKFSTGQRFRSHDKPPPDPDHPEDWSEELNPNFVQRLLKLWRGIDGVGVMAFGVCVPTFSLVSTLAVMPKRMTLVLLNHPFETILEIVMLALIPLANYWLWKAARNGDVRFGLKRGILLGSSIATALVTAGVSIAAGIHTNDASYNELGGAMTVGFSWLFMLSLLTAAASAYIFATFAKTRDFARSKKLMLGYTAIGALVSTLLLAAAEARPWFVRIAEHEAVSSKTAERQAGLAKLENMRNLVVINEIFGMKDVRPFDPGHEMLMECSDPRAAGLCGLFLPLKKSAQQELYFDVLGKPFSFKDINNSDFSAMPDDFVSRHAVGEPVAGLSLVRSLMTASVHAKTLSSTMIWTFVFKNETNSDQDARGEIGLPPGAVVTGLTTWTGSTPKDAIFTATGKAQHDNENWQSTSSGSATVSDLGQNRVLLHCSPVNPDVELKVAIRVVTPLKPSDSKNATMLLPKMMASNFSVDENNDVKLYSNAALASDALKKGATADGLKTLIGTLPSKQLESAEIQVNVSLPKGSGKPVAVMDKLATKMQQQDERRKEAQRLEKRGIHFQPSEVVVMVDARQGIGNQLAQLDKELGERQVRHQPKPRVKVVKPLYMVQSVKPIKSTAPKQLIVVVDGSATMKTHIDALKNALSDVPDNMPVSLMVATSDQPLLTTPLPLNKGGLKLLDQAHFAGGQNNLKSVIDASDLAGASKGGAVLWIHGPQPVVNSEIYPTTPYYAHPAFYELPVDSGEIDTNEFFKNHGDIGPFIQVAHNTNLGADIHGFLARWRPDGAEYTVDMTELPGKPEQAEEVPPNESRELLQLHAYNLCQELLRERKPRRAARIASAYQIVSPVSCAVIDANAKQQDNPEDDAAEVTANNSTPQLKTMSADTLAAGGNAPQLQGATNGTIGPQGEDATYITGVNTAGTVRVNNLANLEALLNILANACEIGCLVAGFVVAVSGFTPAAGHRYADGSRLLRRLAIGGALAFIGFATPGCINWMVASARDANLFS